MKKFFKIGEISKLYGIGVDSIRYYEEIGIIKPERSESGYRHYSIHDIWRLNVIRDLRSIGFSVFYRIFEQFDSLFPNIGEKPLLAAVVGALFVGISVGLCVRVGGAPTGDDALAMSLERVLPLDIQWIYLISDLVVLLISLTYIPVSRITYSLLTVVLSGQIIGLMQKIRFPEYVESIEALEDEG